MNIENNYKTVLKNIETAAEKVGRDPKSILLVAVTKFANHASIKKAIELGILDLGENRIQVALPKISLFEQSPVNWHLIGHLQTNKVKAAVAHFKMIQSVDSLRLAKAIDAEGKKQKKIVDILLEVNISREESKYGFFSNEVSKVLPELATLENIKIHGLMTMAPFYDDVEKTRPVFKALRVLKDELHNNKYQNIEMKHLSMGMTNDYIIAVEEGATIVRIGSGIFKD